MEYKEIIKNAYYHDNAGMLLKGDCLEIMKNFPDKSVDMILCDLPYGTTACKWDSIIPFELLWEQYKKIIKEDGTIVLTASQPFTSNLIFSNIKMFKYCLVWDKKFAGNFANAKYQPLKTHEDIVVFSKASSTYSKKIIMKYNPQMEKRDVPIKRGKVCKSDFQHSHNIEKIKKSDGLYLYKYPVSILHFKRERGLHPAQKPVTLFEYLIKTYTNENDIVLDNAAGSCTTAIACKNTNRKWICIEQELKYCDISVDRIKNYAKTT